MKSLQMHLSPIVTLIVQHSMNTGVIPIDWTTAYFPQHIRMVQNISSKTTIQYLISFPHRNDVRFVFTSSYL